MKVVSELNHKVHIFGMGFVGKSIASRLRAQSEFEVVEYSKKRLDLLSNKTIPLSISKQDRIIFAAAKAPCKSLEDLKYNISLIEGFVSKIQRYEFSYLLNISSDAVYPDSKVPIDESLNLSPTSLHGIMHMTRELYLEKIFPGKVGNIRPTLIYGAYDPHNGYGPNLFVRNAINGQNIKLFGSGEELRDHVYVEDIAAICEFMIETSLVGNINGVSGNTYSFEHVANLVSEIIPSTEIVKIPRIGPVPHNGYRAFDSSTLDKLGLKSRLTPLKYGLRNMIRMERIRANERN